MENIIDALISDGKVYLKNDESMSYPKNIRIGKTIFKTILKDTME